jgi:hypothetical protein
VLVELVDPVRGVLVLDVGQLEQCLAPISLDRLGQGPVEEGRTALGLEVAQEAPRIVRHV